MYKAPLHIYVVWHPKYKTGQKFADQIYSDYSRNINEPLSRGIGIPVFFRSVSLKDNLPRKINLHEAEKNAVLVLIDNNAVIHWKEYIKELQQVIDASGSNNRLFPVSISPNSSNIGSYISGNNFIRLHNITGFQNRWSKLKTDFTHELCRLMYGKPRLSESNSALSDEPVTLFISHAKLDGEEIAIDVKSEAQATTALNTFFDAIDIAPGYKWKNELEANIESSALLVIQTDAYSSREWCRWEVLKAKKNNRPVVVINAVKEGEERSFPYLGNVPTIRWKATGNTKKLIKKILDFTLHEILRFIYSYRFLSTRPGLVSLTGTTKQKILASPPELLTLLEKATEESTKGKIVLYPDPPLTAEELELLMDTTDEFEYLTPTMLAAYTITSKS